MDSRTKLSHSILGLIAEFEHSLEDGKRLYLDDKEYLRIITYYQEELDLDSAIVAADYAIKQYGYRSDFRTLKIKLLINKGLLDHALDAIGMAEIVSPNEIDLKLLKINIFILQKRCDQAGKLIEDLKKNCNPSDLQDVYVAEAYYCESLQEYYQMFQILKKALILNPNNEEALILMNESVTQSKNFEESILLHKVIVDNHPYNHLAWYNLGSAYACVGEYDKAIEASEFSFIINPGFQQGYNDCAEYLVEKNKHSRALEIYQEALTVFGPEIDLLMNIANCEYKLHLVDQAKRTLFEALEIDNYSDEALYLLAKCYINNKDYNSAVKILKKAIAIENGIEEYFDALGRAYHRLNDVDRASYYYNRAAEQGLEVSKYWENYIIFLMEQEKYDVAEKIIQRADRYTFSYRLQYLAASCQILLGNEQYGMDLLKDALIEEFAEHTIIFELPTMIIKNPIILSMINYYEKESV